MCLLQGPSGLLSVLSWDWLDLPPWAVMRTRPPGTWLKLKGTWDKRPENRQGGWELAWGVSWSVCPLVSCFFRPVVFPSLLWLSHLSQFICAFWAKKENNPSPLAQCCYDEQSNRTFGSLLFRKRHSAKMALLTADWTSETYPALYYFRYSLPITLLLRSIPT